MNISLFISTSMKHEFTHTVKENLKKNTMAVNMYNQKQNPVLETKFNQNYK